jgi:two-component system OmpR family response regulator
MHLIPHLLLIEDDRAIAGALTQALRNSYEVEVAFTGRAALYKADIGGYDLIILDLGLPDLTGAAICQQLRERGFTAPILILTGNDNVLTKIKLLDAGADDYLTKPFSLGEFKARLRALLRKRSHLPQPRGPLTVSGITLDRQRQHVSRNGTDINLRRKEFALLECLMEHAGAVVTRQTLTRHAWHGSDDLWTNTVDVHIKSLRDKLDRPFSVSLIRTVHGLGYKLERLEVGVPSEV